MWLQKTVKISQTKVNRRALSQIRAGTQKLFSVHEHMYAAFGSRLVLEVLHVG